MTINRYTVRSFHRHLYAGILESVTLYKRDDDQREGVVTKYTLYGCRWSRIFHTGQAIAGSMASADRRDLHIPKSEMDRVGVAYINALDFFEDVSGRRWDPEATETITVKLCEQHVCVPCRRLV